MADFPFFNIFSFLCDVPKTKTMWHTVMNLVNATLLENNLEFKKEAFCCRYAPAVRINPLMCKG